MSGRATTRCKRPRSGFPRHATSWPARLSRPRWPQGRYKAGVGSILDLLTAQSALAEARSQEAQARSLWFLSIAQLAHSTGVLEPGAPLFPKSPNPARTGGAQVGSSFSLLGRRSSRFRSTACGRKPAPAGPRSSRSRAAKVENKAAPCRSDNRQRAAVQTVAVKALVSGEIQQVALPRGPGRAAGRPPLPDRPAPLPGRARPGAGGARARPGARPRPRRTAKRYDELVKKDYVTASSTSRAADAEAALATARADQAAVETRAAATLLLHDHGADHRAHRRDRSSSGTW